MVDRNAAMKAVCSLAAIMIAASLSGMAFAQGQPADVGDNVAYSTRFRQACGGGDQVKANLTIDTNIAHTFNLGRMNSQVLSLNVHNASNKQAPFYDAADGYDAYVANVLGRLAPVGWQAKL